MFGVKIWQNTEFCQIKQLKGIFAQLLQGSLHKLASFHMLNYQHFSPEVTFQSVPYSIQLMVSRFFLDFLGGKTWFELFCIKLTFPNSVCGGALFCSSTANLQLLLLQTVGATTISVASGQKSLFVSSAFQRAVPTLLLSAWILIRSKLASHVRLMHALQKLASYDLTTGTIPSSP